MKKKNNLLVDTKKEILSDFYQSKTFTVIKYTGGAIISIYALGHIFKLLAFANTNFKNFKQSLKS